MRRIHIIADASGSMLENGKSSAAKYLLFAAGRLCGQLGLEARLWQWRDKVDPLDAVECLVFSGRADEGALLRFLEQGEAVLLLSDGAFSSRTTQRLKEMEQVYVLAVGGDCDLPRLRQSVGVGKVFPAADLAACLQTVKDRGGVDAVC